MNPKQEHRPPGSACVSHAGCGVSPQQSLNFLPAGLLILFEKTKFAMTGRHRQAHETCALPGILR
jgi:hypothetical protein